MIHSALAGVKAAARTDSAALPRVPYPFRADPVALDGLRLDPTARDLMVLLLDNAKDRGWRSRLSNATMGRILGRCPMTISRALGRLEAAGLVRRELAAGGRIRTGIVVTWDGVQAQRLTEQAALRRERLTGSARALEGLGASAELTRAPVQSEDQTRPGSPSNGKEAADYLRRCVAAAKAGEPMPPYPAGPSRTPQDATTTQPAVSPATPAGRPAEGKPAMPRTLMAPLPLDDVMATVRRMVGGLAEGLKAEDLGRRRVGPKRLAAQLAEVRRRHGSGKG